MRCPRRLRVPSLNKIAQAAVRPSPLWEFRAANCFRDLIAKLQNENPRRMGLVPEPYKRHSAQRCNNTADHRITALLNARGYARQV